MFAKNQLAEHTRHLKHNEAFEDSNRYERLLHKCVTSKIN